MASPDEMCDYYAKHVAKIEQRRVIPQTRMVLAPSVHLTIPG